MLNLMLSTSPRHLRTRRSRSSWRLAGPLVVVSLGLIAAAGAAFVGCKSGGATDGSSVSSANLFERQPKRGALSFTVRSNGPGQTVGDVNVAFTQIFTNDAGPSPDLDGGASPDCEPVAAQRCSIGKPARH